MARNRIIYGSQSVFCNGEVLFRVQTLGSNTTFTSEDIFELGHLDIIDVVDDVPAVAVTINTNDWGDVRTLATLAQVPPNKLSMDATATDSNANLTVISGTSEVTYLHGVSLADFAVVCGNLPGVSIWAPVQEECSLGDYLQDNVDQTMYMDEVFVNSIEFGYTTGGNATENYGAETDQKRWLLNDGRFVNYDEFTSLTTSGTSYYVNLSLATPNVVATMSDGSLGFLRSDSKGASAVTYFDVSANQATNVEVESGYGSDTSSSDYKFRYHAAENILWVPTAIGSSWGTDDRIVAIYAANAYGSSIKNHYFRALEDLSQPERIDIGAVRQGQVEVYVVDPGTSATDTGDPSLRNAWRLTGCTITCDLTRETLAELGHLGPYDRPLTLPIPITVAIDATAGDLEHWSRFAKKYSQYSAGTLDEIDLADLMSSDNLKLIVKVFAQTDEEAGGTGENRKVIQGSELDGKYYFLDGVRHVYNPTAGNPVREYALKTIVVDHLKMTAENYTLDMGANATQTFEFRSTNDLYVIKGDISFNYLKWPYKIRRNA